MRKLLLISILLSSFVLFGQSTDCEQCELYPITKKWISKFKRTEGLDAKILMVVNKVFYDGDYFYRDPELYEEPDPTLLDAEPCGEECSLRIGLIYGKREGIVLDVNKYPGLQDVLLELSSENIDRVELKEYEENDIYGHVTDKRSGVVLYTSSKDLRRIIRRLSRNEEREKNN